MKWSEHQEELQWTGYKSEIHDYILTEKSNWSQLQEAKQIITEKTGKGKNQAFPFLYEFYLRNLTANEGKYLTEAFQLINEESFVEFII